ncbi:MAG TPA: hypothetical protein VFC80_07055, partial [Sphaerochaeta sp.]|nr:hypothetical protein [Sphaerochaeta sp.]
FRDDNEYQDLVAKIHPKPSIRTGYLTYEGLTFGYIFISKENQERVYEVKKNHETKHISVYEGQAFIRSGTVNNIMRHNERESLYRKKVLSGKAKNDELFNAVYLKNKFEEENYINKNYAATVEFYCEDNNRTYTVGDGEFTFVLYWYVVDTDVARIKTKIG